MELLITYLTNVGDAFMTWLYGLNEVEVGIGIALTVLVIAFRKSLASLVIRVTVAVAGAIGVVINETVRERIGPAVRALIVSLSLFILLEALDLPDIISGTLGKILASIAIVAIFAAVYSFTEPLSALLQPYRTERTKSQFDWLINLAKGVVVILGAAAVLGIWGIDLGPVLTGMGVFGAGMALAAQDLLKNVIAGVTNMSERRFGVGDWIRVDGVIEGTVERVEFRSTLVRRFDMGPVQVPNSKLADSTLTNFSRMPHRRIYWSIGLRYSTTTEQLARIRDAVEKYITDSEDFVSASQATTIVRIDSFSASSIDMIVYRFTPAVGYVGYMEIKERLVFAIKDAVEGAGSFFAFPSRSVYVEAAPHAGPDRFEPAAEPG